MKVLDVRSDEVLKLGLGWPANTTTPNLLIGALKAYVLAHPVEQTTHTQVKYERDIDTVGLNSLQLPGSENDTPELSHAKKYVIWLKDDVFIRYPEKIQFGACYGTCSQAETFETHGLREVVIAVTPLWLALVPNLTALLRTKNITKDDICLVRLREGEGFVIAAETGHYAPLVRPGEQFIAGIVLPEGVNAPGKTATKTIGKYVVTSPGTPEAKAGWPVRVDGPFEFKL